MVERADKLETEEFDVPRSEFASTAVRSAGLLANLSVVGNRSILAESVPITEGNISDQNESYGNYTRNPHSHFGVRAVESRVDKATFLALN